MSASKTAMRVEIDGMREEMTAMREEFNGLLQINRAMATAIVQLRVSVAHGRDNPIVIDDVSSDEGTVAESPEIAAEHRLVPIEDLEVGVVPDSEEESEEEVWEISREEFEEEELIDTRHSSPEL